MAIHDISNLSIKSKHDVDKFIDKVNDIYIKITDNSHYWRKYTIDFDEFLLDKDNKLNKKKEFRYIQEKIESISDILDILDKYPLKNNIQYNIDIESLLKIKVHLIELNNMIGMKQLKQSVFDQIIYYIQGFHKLSKSNNYLHTVIYGPPGTGKTAISKIIGKIYSKLGILKNNVFKVATRADLVAGYLGQTAIKTRNMIRDCIGGVLFIDEAYSLGNPEKRDSFSKECIDTLCESLSNYKDELMVIIAGYETELNESFFQYNKGLDSRFPWRFKIDTYSFSELKDIFIKKVKDDGWRMDVTENILLDFFKNNYNSFPYFGRDIEHLFSKIKITHSRRVFGLDDNKKTIITEDDIISGFTLYKELDNIKKDVDKDNLDHLYL